MLTPADLQAMTPEQRTALFDQMATAYWGDARYGEKAAADFETNRVTISRWKTKNIVPCTVLFTLDAWLNSEQYAAKMFQDLKALPEELSAACQHLATAGKTLATLAQRFPRFIQTELAASSHGPGASGAEPRPGAESPQ